jgi:N,N'-diacetyllegionaminate synthase
LDIIKKILDNNHGPYTIAEVGINHNGNVSIAKKLIKKAYESGVSSVKLQTFKAESMCLQSSPYYSLFKQCELSSNEIIELNSYANDIGITLFSAVFDEWAVDLWASLNPPLIKIASGDITHIPLIKYTALTGIPMILSTGGSSIEEIENAIDAIRLVNKKSSIALLHCVSNYPTNIEKVNLNCMEEMKNKFKVPIGFSDHTIDNIASISAVAKGAQIIERHFTLDKSMDGPDHQLSSDPEEFKSLIKEIKQAYMARGSYKKHPIEEENFIKAIRRSITSKIKIDKGALIEKHMLIIRRPGTGIQPRDFDKVLNSKAKRDIMPNEIISWKDIEL